MENLNFIIDNLLSDLAEFLNLSFDEVARRLDPKYFNKVWFDDFIRNSDYETWLEKSEYYLYDLTQWHLDSRDHLLAFYALQPKVSAMKSLDFGAGIGTRSMFDALNGWDVTLVEINKPCLAFAKFRFEKYGLQGVFKRELDDVEVFDKVEMIDVVGHLTNPRETFRQVSLSMKSGAYINISWDLFEYTSTGKIHRNKEVDFAPILAKNNLVKVTETRYRKQ